MPSTVQKQKRRIRLIPGIVAVAAFAAIAIADQPVHRAARKPAGGARPGSTYFIDPDTGQQREPSPQELLDLQRQSLQEVQQPQAITSSQGFAGLQLTDDQMMYTVATRNADGSISVSHAEGKKAAERQLKQLTERGVTAGKEERLER